MYKTLVMRILLIVGIVMTEVWVSECSGGYIFVVDSDSIATLRVK